MTDQHDRRRDASRIRDLQITDESFRLLVESVRDYGIFLLDDQGHVMTWNTGAEALKGYRADEIIGRHFSCFYEESDVTHGKPDQLLEMAKQEDRVEDEGWRVRKDGSRFWADVVITVLRDEGGRVRGFAKITRDLTERREGELLLEHRVEERTAALQASNTRLQETVRELEEFHDAVVDRELMMIALEKRIAELEAALKQSGLKIPPAADAAE